MRRWLPFFLLLVGTSARAEETVRIAIVDGVKQVTLTGPDLESRELGSGEKYAPTPGGRSAVYLSKEQMFIDGAPVQAPDGLKFRSKGLVRVADKPVRGQIEIRRNGSGLIAINVIPLEDYLAAVLGSEMPRSFPLEALKAQAVAARTYALQKKILAWGKPFHLGATVLHQVYGGTQTEDARTRQAVEATEGEVLVWRMEPIEAYFHSSCGGRTEAGGEALGRDLPYLKPAECPCGVEPRNTWTQELRPADFARLMADVREVKVVERTPTGRARRVVLLGAKGATRSVGGVELRRSVGYDRIKSLDFSIERSGKGFSLSGRGYGHGAGMCQWGAKTLADRGWDYRRIVGHYYPGAELRKMY